MSDINKHPDNEPEKGGIVQKGTTKRLRVASLFSLVSMALMTGFASAETVNWSEITTMLDGIVTIFPSISAMITGIVPTLMILAVVGFVMRFFKSIIKIIESATTIFK
ncbi:hypothetical protein V7O66_03375 [Methanolobus sp. ZRKC3]|uniref:hypothetical protein n=1 Tax=Methanolobus sp. ZRKC3 TaxID=3125786 RepID=UPI003250CCD2